MKYPTVTLFSAMILAGALGGWMNYLMAEKEDPERRSYVKSLVLGVGASFMVPLLLNMISSNLTELAQGDWLKLLVFAGICLVAAVFSNKFTEQPDAPHISGTKTASLGEQDHKILKALADPRFAYRFTTGVTKDAKLPYGEVEKRLTDLTKLGLTGRTVRERDGQVLWYLTSDGQRSLSATEPGPGEPGS